MCDEDEENNKFQRFHSFFLFMNFSLSTVNGIQTTEETHLIFGKATYGPFGPPANSAAVEATSSSGTLQTQVGFDGGWPSGEGQVECNWLNGTVFTVSVIGCCGHQGWEGSKSGDVDGDTDMGVICVTEGDDSDSPSFPILEWILKIFPNAFPISRIILGL